MKNFIYILAYLICLTGSYANAQTPEKKYIEVTGTSEIEIVPDEITLKMTLVEKADAKESETIVAQENRLRKALDEAGLDSKRLALAEVSSYVRYKTFDKSQMLKKVYLLKVNSVAQINNVFQVLEKLDITDAYIYSMTHSRMDSLKKEARIMAIKAAKGKADYLLAALGEQTGEPLFVIEKSVYEGNTSHVYGNVRANYSYMSARDENEEGAILPKKIKVEAGIEVRFEIK